MSKTLSLHHIVFATKQRRPTLPLDHRRQLYQYIWGIIKKRNCYVYRINGMRDHVHILLNLNPTVALSSLVGEVKTASSNWLKNNPDFPNFDGWGAEYFAATVSASDRDACINYIATQDTHHATYNFYEELDRLFEQCMLSLHSNDLK